MQPTKVDKMHSPRGYNAVRPPTTQTPGSRGGTPAKHGGSRTPGTGGRGAFTGSPPAVTAPTARSVGPESASTTREPVSRLTVNLVTACTRTSPPGRRL